jgi:hypothetical protein
MAIFSEPNFNFKVIASLIMPPWEVEERFGTKGRIEETIAVIVSAEVVKVLVFIATTKEVINFLVESVPPI